MPEITVSFKTQELSRGDSMEGTLIISIDSYVNPTIPEQPPHTPEPIKKTRSLSPRYIFKGKRFTMNRLALEIVKVYVADNPATSFSELLSIFPTYLRKGEIFTTKEKALITSNRVDIKSTRHFVKAGEFIMLSDEIVAVVYYWEQASINKIIHIATQLGYSIETCEPNS